MHVVAPPTAKHAIPDTMRRGTGSLSHNKIAKVVKRVHFEFCFQDVAVGTSAILIGAGPHHDGVRRTSCFRVHVLRARQAAAAQRQLLACAESPAAEAVAVVHQNVAISVVHVTVQSGVLGGVALPSVVDLPQQSSVRELRDDKKKKKKRKRKRHGWPHEAYQCSLAPIIGSRGFFDVLR
eukprot:CAMPEP_0115631680 /NCGR_PEP_ID=MMETSP0272-20121206/31122_1 /TAXON_ID=71861 /ORGANISM="Scrippsiella trochoidea, Strain CCMP3099" /LENGTH=179 /DNA_ID=CAMNT_0003068349 /DNA_START=100 /DNA_END=639 /DNA_ORIENTATION=+